MFAFWIFSLLSSSLLSFLAHSLHYSQRARCTGRPTSLARTCWGSLQSSLIWLHVANALYIPSNRSLSPLISSCYVNWILVFCIPQQFLIHQSSKKHCKIATECTHTLCSMIEVHSALKVATHANARDPPDTLSSICMGAEEKMKRLHKLNRRTGWEPSSVRRKWWRKKIIKIAHVYIESREWLVVVFGFILCCGRERRVNKKKCRHRDYNYMQRASERRHNKNVETACTRRLRPVQRGEKKMKQKKRNLFWRGTRRFYTYYVHIYRRSTDDEVEELCHVESLKTEQQQSEVVSRWWSVDGLSCLHLPERVRVVGDERASERCNMEFARFELESAVEWNV